MNEGLLQQTIADLVITSEKQKEGDAPSPDVYRIWMRFEPDVLSTAMGRAHFLVTVAEVSNRIVSRFGPIPLDVKVMHEENSEMFLVIVRKPNEQQS